MRAIKFLQHAVIQDGHLVEIDDGLEFVGDGDDGMLGEFLADDALDEGVGGVVDACDRTGSACYFQIWEM